MAGVLVGAGRLPSAQSWLGRRRNVHAQPDNTIVAHVEPVACGHQSAIWRSRNAVQVAALQSGDGRPARAPEHGRELGHCRGVGQQYRQRHQDERQADPEPPAREE